MKLFVAVDIGTTHCKAVIIDEHAKPVYAAKRNVVSVQDEQGKHEQDAEAIFQEVLSLLKECFEKYTAKDISCISFSAAMHSLLATDPEGKPLMYAMTWADTRSAAYGRELRKTKTGLAIYANTGTPLHAMSPLCKLLWLKNEQPAIYHAAHKFISIKEYIFFRLFGKYIVDAGIASATGLYNSYKHCWDEDALQLTGIDASKLSAVVPATHIETGLLNTVQQLPEAANIVPFVVGGNDGCLANLGCGALTNDIAVLTIGTSGAVRLTIPPAENGQPVIAKGNGLFRYLLTEDIMVIGGPINNGGVVLQWFADNFLQLPLLVENNFEKVMQLASTETVQDLLFLPYLLGERAPVWDELATGLFYGLRISHTRAHLTRAVVEGISFSLLQIFKETEKNNPAIESVYVSGIVTKSEFWMQLLADMFGKNIILNEVADASAMGAAFMGMYATGHINQLAEVNKFINPSKVFKSDSKVNELYTRKFAQYCNLYPAMQSVGNG